MTTLVQIILAALASGPLSRPEIEAYAIQHGYAASGVCAALWQLKKRGLVRHLRRASRHRSSIYDRA